MAILATFIGVDRYAAADIRDLTGARRDAESLGAIFKDTLPDATITTLIDEDATMDAIQNALANTLEAAEPEDIAIFSFSGHGSKDHHLVLHDTSRQNLHLTSISMQEVAEFFTSSKAGTIICILDCCFSGEAPGRVLEGTPQSRDSMDPFREIIGSGRVIIAACDAQEVAYEHPQFRLGLLTKAIIESLCDGVATNGIGQLIDKILEDVRAEAGKIGVVQTPHIVNQVFGGLSLPVFIKGENYHKAFPEYSTIKIAGNIADLQQFNLPQIVLQSWEELYPNGLNELQVQAVNEGGVLRNQSVVVVAPTSSGKTFVGELATAKVIAENRKAVFLFPYKALVNEKFDQFSSLYQEKLDYRVIRVTGDYSDQTSKLLQGKYDLAILTYEMFLSMSLDRPEILYSIGLVVVDEVHFITDPYRGITVELILTHLLLARTKGIQPQIVCLSAVVGDVNAFDKWLDCGCVISTKRPVPLIEGVIDRTGTYQFIDIDGIERTEQLVASHEIKQRKSEPSVQDIIVPLAKKLMMSQEKIIIFRNMRGSAQGCAAYLAAELGLSSASQAIILLPQSDKSSSSESLRECLHGGTAFHTSNLKREEREIVEKMFRDPTGQIQVLAATTTVAAGINTPADTVIIAESQFKGEDGRSFTIAEYKNMAGRAGRLGIRELGRSIMYAETTRQRQQLFTQYVKGRLENLHSSFDKNDIDTWLLRLLAQTPPILRTEVTNLLARSYGGYLQNRINPKWQTNIIEVVEANIERMIALDLLEVENHKVSLTLLGRACGRSSLAFSSAIRLVELIKKVNGEINPIVITALIQCLPEMDRTYTPVGAKGNGKEQEWISRFSKLIGREYIQTMQRFVQDQRAYVARCKRACIIHDWMSGVPLNEIEQRYTTNQFVSVNYGDIANIANTTRFHLRSAVSIVSLLVFEPEKFNTEIDDFLNRMELGIPEKALAWMKVPSLQRGDILALCNAGFNSPDMVKGLTQFQLLEILGPGSANRINELL